MLLKYMKTVRKSDVNSQNITDFAAEGAVGAYIAAIHRPDTTSTLKVPTDHEPREESYQKLKGDERFNWKQRGKEIKFPPLGAHSI